MLEMQIEIPNKFEIRYEESGAQSAVGDTRRVGRRLEIIRVWTHPCPLPLGGGQRAEEGCE